MNRAYTPTRRDFSRDGAPLLSVVKASQAARRPNYALGDKVTWHDGKADQTGYVHRMEPDVTHVEIGEVGSGKFARLAIDRPRRAT